MDATVNVHFRLNEVLIRRDGEVTHKKSFILNHSTMGFYRQKGITFKIAIKTRHLIVSQSVIHIEYEHTIEGSTTQKNLRFKFIYLKVLQKRAPSYTID